MHVLLLLFLFVAVRAGIEVYNVSGVVDEMVKYFNQELSHRPIKEMKMPDLDYENWQCYDGWLKKISSIQRIGDSILKPAINNSRIVMRLGADLHVGFDTCDYQLEDGGTKTRDKIPTLTSKLDGVVNSTSMEFHISLINRGKECVANFQFFLHLNNITLPAPTHLIINGIMNSNYMGNIQRKIKDIRHKPCKLLHK